MSLTIEPEPSDAEREAIVAAALELTDDDALGEWAAAALAEGVESAEPDP